MQLPRVGAKTAERIVAFRKQHGGFQRPEELMNVKGIGEKSYAKLKPYLNVSAAPRPAAPKKLGGGHASRLPVLRPGRHHPAGARLCMAIAGVLTLAGTWAMEDGGIELSAAHQEIHGSLEQAFTLARARGTNVTVALGKASGAGEHLPVQLGRHIKWGKPASIPLPPDMDAPLVATSTGESHPLITVTPRRTALASVWFLNDGREALCMRLSGRGHLQVLRWKHDRKTWMNE